MGSYMVYYTHLLLQDNLYIRICMFVLFVHNQIPLTDSVGLIKPFEHCPYNMYGSPTLAP